MRFDAADVVLVLGCLLVAGGIALWSLPAGVVALGLACVGLALGIAGDGDARDGGDA